MLFSDFVPEGLKVHTPVENFLKVLDGLQFYKEQEIYKSTRIYNAVLNTNLAHLRKVLSRYGYPEIPEDFPKEILDNMYLNAENVFRLQGSKMGLDYLLRVLTCGEPTINDADFYPKASYIIPGDLDAGYLFAPQDYPLNTLYLYSGVDNYLPRFLYISIATPYHNLQSLKKYIETNIYRFITFTDENTTVSITLTEGAYVRNPYAEPYFNN